MLFRILLFKLFNKESTWELLLNNFEDITLKTFNVKDYSKVLENAISNGIKIYNDAYISCANKAFGYDRKHDNHLALLNKMFNEDKIQEKIVKCKTMEEAFNIIKRYPLIGNFMAYQLVTDINYSEIVNWREDEFTVAGPGSLRGIKKCFINKGKMSNEDIIRYMYEHQDEEFKRLNLNFKRIGNRPLQLIDCQNIFCELDKYCRQAVPELKSNNYMVRQFGQRVAMNTPIQGTAADIMKIAMIHVYQELQKRKLSSKIVLQVHDEMMIEAPIEEAEIVKNIVKESMESAVTLKIPLIAEVSEAENWYECK
mgnify:CR=1 FL=1